MVDIRNRYPIGIDIGDGDLYAVQLRETRSGLEIRALAHRELKVGLEDLPAGEEIFTGQLKEILREKGFFGKTAVVQLTSEDILTFPLRLKVDRTESVEDAILRESREYLPFPVEDAILDYPSLHRPSGEDKKEYKVVVVAIHRDRINQYLRLLGKGGLSVAVVETGISSLVRLHGRTHGLDEQPVILCNIGRSRSLISIVNREDILAQRTIRWGVGHLLDKVLSKLELAHQKSRAGFLLGRYGLSYENRHESESPGPVDEGGLEDQMYRAVYRIITPEAEALVYELHRLIGYVRAEEHGTDFKGVYLYGRASFVAFLDHFIENRLNLDTRSVDPFDKLNLSGPDTLDGLSDRTNGEGGMPFALAVGSAMRKVAWL